MPNRKDLEEMFVVGLEKKRLGYVGKIFTMGETAILADYMFGDTMVVFVDRVSDPKVQKLSTFKTLFPNYNIILVTEKCSRFLGQKWFSEIYDGKSLATLIDKLKEMSSKKR